MYWVRMKRLETFDSINLGNGIGTGLTSGVHSQTVACLYRTAFSCACGTQIANIRADEKMGILSVIYFDSKFESLNRVLGILVSLKKPLSKFPMQYARVVCGRINGESPWIAILLRKGYT